MAKHGIESLKKAANIMAGAVVTPIATTIAIVGAIAITPNKGENSSEDDEDFGQKYGWKK